MMPIDYSRPQKIRAIQRPPKGVSPQASNPFPRVVIMHPIIQHEKMKIAAPAAHFLSESFLAIPRTCIIKLIQIAN